jgi:hypothetical protein
LCQPILNLAVQLRAEFRRQQRAQHVNVVRLGESGRPENEQRFDVLLDALLGVKANRIGRALPTQGERVRRGLQVIVRLGEPLADHDEDGVKGGHT